jgi:hypothetical protein
MKTIDLLGPALELAARGFAVFPLAPRSKVPLAGTRGSLDATRDPARIVRMWQREPSGNIGLATGAASGIWVLDVDDRHDGAATMRGLVAELGPLPPTLRVRTGSGWHLYFRLDGALVPQGANVLGPGVDTRSTGGYVVAPPSLHPSGATYRWLTEIEPAACPPPWLARLAPPPAPVAPPHREAPRTQVTDRAARWALWMSENKPSIQGSNGSGALYAAAVGLVVGFELPDVHALDLLRAFNATAKPPWPERDLVRVIQRAGRSNRPRGYLLNQPRSAA